MRFPATLDGEPLETWEDWSEVDFLAERRFGRAAERPLSNAVLAEARDVLSDAEDGCHLHLHEDDALVVALLGSQVDRRVLPSRSSSAHSRRRLIARRERRDPAIRRARFEVVEARDALLARYQSFETACRVAGSPSIVGVDSSTGMLRRGVPLIVTWTVAVVIDGIRAWASTGVRRRRRRRGCAADRRRRRAQRRLEQISQAFGHGRLASTRSAGPRSARSRKDESNVAILLRAPRSTRGRAPPRRCRANGPAAARSAGPGSR